MIYDISVPLHNNMHVWPSDPKLRLEEREHPARDQSHTVRVTSIRCGSHSGTHLDAPSHMIDDGRTLSDIPLEQLVGPARVLDIPGVRSIGRAELEDQPLKGVERVLFRTDNSSHWNDPGFYEDFVFLEPDGALFLIESGIRLVGIDYLSIDRYKSSDHATHFILLEQNVVILEGLNLCDIAAGDYNLTALPMKLRGADGAPVRAILVDS